MTKKEKKNYHISYYRMRRAKDPLYNEYNRLKSCYNLSMDQYECMVEQQKGKCLLCGRIPKGRLVIDHDHACCPGKRSCGKCIRGLLCKGCNWGLGYLGDNLIGLKKAVAYLEKI